MPPQPDINSKPYICARGLRKSLHSRAVVHNNLSNIVRSHHLQSGTSGQHDSSASFSSGKDALVSNAGQLKIFYFTSACCLQHAQA